MIKMKVLKKCMCLLITLTMCIGLITVNKTEVSAASATDKAKAAYKKVLETHKYLNQSEEKLWNLSNTDNNKHYDYYYLKDITGDGVPELFTVAIVSARYEVVRVFTYKSGKVVPLKFSNKKNVIFDNNHSANGTYTTYICKKGHIHNSWSGYVGTEEDVYKVTGGKLKKISSCNSNASVNIYSKAKKNTKANRDELVKAQSTKIYWLFGSDAKTFKKSGNKLIVKSDSFLNQISYNKNMQSYNLPMKSKATKIKSKTFILDSKCKWGYAYSDAKLSSNGKATNIKKINKSINIIRQKHEGDVAIALFINNNKVKKVMIYYE